MSSHIKPITPAEVSKQKNGDIPDFVLAAFNHMIAKKFSDGVSRFTQNEVITEISKRWVSDGTLRVDDCRQEIFNNHWLDVEPIYRSAGWSVEYDKPGYCEDYEATFIFKSRRVRRSKNQED